MSGYFGVLVAGYLRHSAHGQASGLGTSALTSQPSHYDISHSREPTGTTSKSWGQANTYHNDISAVQGYGSVVSLSLKKGKVHQNLTEE